MRKQYIKGLRGEIVALDDIDRFWKVLDEKTSNWEVWADSRKHSTQIFEGDETAVNDFMAALCVLFEPYDLSNAEDRDRLKLSGESHR